MIVRRRRRKKSRTSMDASRIKLPVKGQNHTDQSSVSDQMDQHYAGSKNSLNFLVDNPLIPPTDSKSVRNPSSTSPNEAADSITLRSKVRLKQQRLSSYLCNIYYLICLFILHLPEASGAIGCFVCSSFSGSNTACEDIFNSTIYRAGVRSNVGIYQFPCWSSKKQRKGLFPADHCVKVSGYRTDNPNQTMVIRTCALDSGTLTADTEIVRISHCGYFNFDGHQYTGCVQACDTDGCNGTPNVAFSVLLLIAASLSLIIHPLLLCNNFMS